MKIFDVAEIFKFAVEIEQNGEKFYRRTADMAKDAESKKLFTFLADEEVKHKKLFEGMISKKDQYEPFENYPGEYQQYMDAYTGKIISNPDIQKEMDSVKDTPGAIEFGIRRELDSILFYHEVKKFVGNDASLIDKIIDEERKHFMTLVELKNKK